MLHDIDTTPWLLLQQPQVTILRIFCGVWVSSGGQEDNICRYLYVCVASFCDLVISTSLLHNLLTGDNLFHICKCLHSQDCLSLSLLLFQTFLHHNSWIISSIKYTINDWHKGKHLPISGGHGVKSLSTLLKLLLNSLYESY